MAVGDSIIRVTILGDARKLTTALGDADKATGGLLVSAGKVLVAAKLTGDAVGFAFDTVQSGLAKADAFHDALDRIAGVTTQEFANRIHDVAFSMTEIGLSADEVGNLAANFDAFATAAKVSEPTIESITPHMIELAAAVAATTGKTVDEVIGDIGKAAAGNQKSVSDYGIVVDKALNPDARILDILAQLDAKFPDVKAATDDLAGSQATLNAKWDNFTIKLGEALDGPLKGVVDWLNDEIDAIPGAIQGWESLGHVIENFGRFALGPLGNVKDAIDNLNQSLLDAIFNLTHIGTGLNRSQFTSSGSEANQNAARDNYNLRNGQGSP